MESMRKATRSVITSLPVTFKNIIVRKGRSSTRISILKCKGLLQML